MGRTRQGRAGNGTHASLELSLEAGEGARTGGEEHGGRDRTTMLGLQVWEELNCRGKRGPPRLFACLSLT